MLRFALAAVAAVLLTTAASAQQINCSNTYKDFWEKMQRDFGAKVSGEQLAGVNRQALRAYDTCLSGDEINAKQFFEKLQRDFGAKKQ